jgi:hypothetical protein
MTNNLSTVKMLTETVRFTVTPFDNVTRKKSEKGLKRLILIVKSQM